MRTRDWVAPYGAGQFQVLVDGAIVGTFGKGGSGAWDWWDGGIVTVASVPTEVVLRDLTGFEGRVDALCFSRNLAGAAPPNGKDFAWRRQALGYPEQAPSAGSFDFCVVGGGFAGMCAAVAAAREGLSVALVQDRPVFGGNGSEECRVIPQGEWGNGPFPKNRNIMEEIRALIPKHQGPACDDNYKPDSAAWDRWLRSWSWETGFYRDPVRDGEDIRDTMLRGIWGWWDFAKNRSPKKANYAKMEIYQMGYILGKRDAHRIIGDYIVTEEDLVQHKVYPDGVVDTTWFIDLHTPHGEFRTAGCTDSVKIQSYPIPYRCFYSRDIANLFMAGKDISGTYRAMASFRVQNTTAQMGSMVGKAASLCVRNGWTPRELGRDHFDALKAALKK